jgi:hypothetical protein
MTDALARQQRAFQRVVVTDGPVHGLFADPKATLAVRLAIYQRAYRSRLAEALRANYPVVHRALGDERFATLAAAFIAARPSRRASIRWFGENLARFVADREDLLPHPALLDLVRLEWALCLAFDAADRSLLTAASLGSVPPADWPVLRLAAHPSLQVISLQWEVGRLWQALKADENAATEAPAARVHDVVVWRKDLSPHWRSLEPMEAACLRALVGGETFATLCEVAAAYVGPQQAPAQMAGLLTLWLGDGLLVGPAPDGG